jgi:hypothetical protein
VTTDGVGARVADHLRDRLQRSAMRELTPEEAARLHEEGEERFLQSLVLSSKFRKWAADQSARERITGAIASAVAERKPVRFLHTMGGYKLWSMPTTPEVDWAELFNVAYHLKYLSGIAAAYPPGVTMTYYLYTLLPQRHDNLPAADVHAYVASFTALIDGFRSYLPGNVSLAIVKDTDLYERDEYYALLDDLIARFRPRFSSLNEALRNDLLVQSRRNIQWNGTEDWATLDEAEQEDKILLGAITEIAGMSMKKQGEFIGNKDHVLLFVKAGRGNGFLGIGSTKSSVTKHWTGIGLLEDRGGKLHDVILSPTQWHKVESLPRQVCEVDLLGLRNLKQAMVVAERLDFSRG